MSFSYIDFDNPTIFASVCRYQFGTKLEPAYRLKVQTVVFCDLCNSIMVGWYAKKDGVNYNGGVVCKQEL